MSASYRFHCKCEKWTDEHDMSVGQRTIWDPDRNWTHDLPNTGQALYSLSYKNSDCVIFYLVHLHVLHFITELKIHHLYSFIRFHGTFQRQMFFKILSFSTLKKENGVIGKENTKRKQFFHFITPCYSPQSLYCFIHLHSTTSEKSQTDLSYLIE